MSEPHYYAEVIQGMYTPKRTAERKLEVQVYRKGYHQAYDKALEDVFTLLKKGVSVEEAYALTALQANLIGDWRASLEDWYVEPPPFDLESLQETLALRRRMGKA